MLGFKPRPKKDIQGSAAAAAAAAAPSSDLIRILNDIKARVTQLKNSAHIGLSDKNHYRTARVNRNILYSIIHRISPILQAQNSYSRALERIEDELEQLPSMIGKPVPNGSTALLESNDEIFFYAHQNEEANLRDAINYLDIWLEDFEKAIAKLQAAMRQ